MKKGNSSLKIGILVSMVSFVVLTFLTDGLVEVSRDVGVWRWVSEMTVYALTNKLAEKVLAAVALGGISAFVAHLINYSRAVKNQRRGRMTRLQFAQEDPNHTRTA